MLYVVGTPIGNLDDITVRALATLKSVDLIAAEDTRHSGNLLRHFEIRKPLVSYHEHNEAMRTAELAERLAAGETIALITDAGMPGLSDPGARLIRKCIERELPFTIIPGVSAITTGLVGSGFALERFCYRGFLPVKSGQRARELTAAAAREETTVFFESPHRINKTLAACAELMPDRALCVARELTKKFEEFRRGTAAGLLAHYEAHPAKGEITLLIAGAEERASNRGDERAEAGSRIDPNERRTTDPHR
jgi:16S rRNA (cytidine1402-2'-O)-methyltransferase